MSYFYKIARMNIWHKEVGTLINRVLDTKIGCKQRALKEVGVGDRSSSLGGSEDSKDPVGNRG